MDSTSSHQSHMESFYSSTPCPYLAWKQYLPDTPYSDCSPIIPLITAATTFIKKDTKLVTRDELFEQRFFLLDFEKLSSDAEILGEWPSLGEELEDRTERVCGVFGLAMHHLLSAPDTGPASVPHLLAATA